MAITYWSRTMAIDILFPFEYVNFLEKKMFPFRLSIGQKFGDFFTKREAHRTCTVHLPFTFFCSVVMKVGQTLFYLQKIRYLRILFFE
jgi:hypothetical protein